ncbi:MAG TPA: FxSxx-COOH system tetratricopeptide repeat protein [Methanothrix sp.]|nr:FxSxx-COOH system tetratricopeptide repeat protein [Methanothrix sp.]HPJ84256.1 FxSxx-COOH system tetratricopeptide repeat protein [Methanothrix sp.]HPR66374.1 FxSxx-COOH system tetratricopeptide repeat protein [Methanothrix sp.]
MIDFFLKGRRNPHFAGRKSILKDLEDALYEGEPVVLTGPDGMGKSAIVEEHGRIHVTDYDFRLWVRAWDETVLGSDYAALAEPLRIPFEEDSDIGDLAGSVRTWLEENGRWLVVFDNAPSLEALEAYLPRAGAGGGDVIITSNSSGWDEGFTEIEVGPLEAAEAAAFLSSRTGQDDRESSEKLAELLDGGPLALELAGAYIKWTGISLSRYLEAYKKRFAEISGRTPPGCPEALAAVWDISMEQVRAVSQEGVDLLSLSAFLAPEDLPIDLLVKAAALLPESVDPGLLALDRRGLVRRDGEALSVHPLIQSLAFGRLDDEKKKIWADETARAIGGAFSSYLEDLSTWPECARLLPHALASTEKVEELGIGSEPASLLLNQMGLYLHRRGELAGARNVLERLIVLDERFYGPNHPEVATDLNNLGSVLRVLGDLADAKRCFGRALAIEERQSTPDSLKIAIRANNLGTVLRSLGDLEGALDQFERALAIDRDAYGPNHFKTAIRLNNRGEVLQEIGDLEGARESYQRAFRIFQQFLGPGHHYTQRAQENLDSLSRKKA